MSDVKAGLEPVTLDLARLYAETQPLVTRTLNELDSIFDQVRGFGIDPENPRELGAVYLVGGATAFPLVTRSLRERYGRKVLLAPQPHAATAVGLAIAADPDSGIFVREAVTRHFGVWREGERGREKIFDRIISKGALPEDGRLLIERRYRPVHAVGHLRYLECSGLGTGGEPAGDLTPWGEILFPYDPALADIARPLRRGARPAPPRRARRDHGELHVPHRRHHRGPHREPHSRLRAGLRARPASVRGGGVASSGTASSPSSATRSSTRGSTSRLTGK